MTLVATVPELLAVNPRLPAANLAELLAHARARPGQLNFASSGNGSMPHLAGEQLRFVAGAAFAAYIAAEATRWGEVVRRSGATAD